jgi:hypothetical protein
VSLSILYYKFAIEENQIVKSEELSHNLVISHNQKYDRTINWIINDYSPEIISNTGGLNAHTNMS